MGVLRVGLVGCGHISQAHLKGWKTAPGCELEGVFDVTRNLAETRAKEFGVAHIYDALEELIRECDIVDVCTPPHTHAAIACQAASAGKHLVIEKPVVTDLNDWEDLSSILKRSSSKIAVIHNLKYSYSLGQARKWIETGQIGHVLRIQHEFLTAPNTDRMLKGAHWSHALPGGRWFETLPHPLYMTHALVGPMELAGVRVLSTTRAVPGAQADEVIISLENDDCLGTIHFSANCEQNKRRLSIQGSRGNITIDLLGDWCALSQVQDTRWRRAMGGMMAWETARQGLALPADRIRYGIRHLQGQTPHTLAIAAFARYLQGQGAPPTPLDEIDYVVRYSDRIGRAIDTERMERAS